MSLKTFHIVFIIASTLVTLFFGGWGWMNYFSDEGTPIHLVYGIGSVAALGGLGWYAVYFLQKLKSLSYL